jgi:predicted MFS family arabinose efflux permease
MTQPPTAPSPAVPDLERPQPGPDGPALWRDRDFRRFWIGQGVSSFGDEVSALALPLVAVIVLGASATQMGIITALGYLPFLLVGLQAGVWVDRMRRRRILIWADLAQAALLLTVPAAAITGLLRIEQLYVLALLIGGINVVASVAQQSFLPSLVRRQHLPAANSRLEATRSVTGIVGPSVAGVLVQLLTAPIAVFVNAVTLLASAGLLASMRTVEPPPLPEAQRRGMRAQVAEGLRIVLRHELLRPLMSCGMTHNFFRRMFEAIFVLYLVNELGIDAALLGLIIAAGGPGALLGALAAVPVARRIGIGPTVVWAQVLTGIACLATPLAGGPIWLVALILATGEFLLGAARTLFNITQLSLRQAITPDRLQGRVNATMRFMMWGVTPVGALSGGLLGSAIGLRPALLVAAVGVLLAFGWVAFTAVGRLREQPEPHPG